jgi:PAS domain S-box-containing protein
MLKLAAEKFDLDIQTESQNDIFKQNYSLCLSDIHKKFFELSPDMLCVIGFDGRFKKVSPAFERILGYKQNEMVSRSYSEFIHPEDDQKIINELKNLNLGSPSIHFENRYISKNGIIVWLAWRYVTVAEEKLVYAIARDITDQKKIELEMREQSEKLAELIKHKNSGLRYGQLLQEAIFHDPETLNDIFPQAFIFHSPKDIVSGDFYWFEKVHNKAILVCADSTGHGVPGSILSVLGINKLHEIISSKRHTQPSKILYHFNDVVFKALSKKKQGKKKVHDGMDISLFSVDQSTRILEYAGANNSIYIVRKGKLIELEADNFGIGIEQKQIYANQIFQCEKDDMIYAFTDGYADQFGGEKGKKFMYKKFKALLIAISDKSAEIQKQIVTETIKTWMGTHEQIDDMCVVGVRIE